MLKVQLKKDQYHVVVQRNVLAIDNNSIDCRDCHTQRMMHNHRYNSMEQQGQLTDQSIPSRKHCRRKVQVQQQHHHHQASTTTTSITSAATNAHASFSSVTSMDNRGSSSHSTSTMSTQCLPYNQDEYEENNNKASFSPLPFYYSSSRPRPPLHNGSRSEEVKGVRGVKGVRCGSSSSRSGKNHNKLQRKFRREMTALLHFLLIVAKIQCLAEEKNKKKKKKKGKEMMPSLPVVQRK